MSQVATYKPDNLIAGTFPLITQSITIASNQILKRGAVLGRITASDKYVLSQATSKDGSEQTSAILCEDVDTTAIFSSSEKECWAQRPRFACPIRKELPRPYRTRACECVGLCLSYFKSSLK